VGGKGDRPTVENRWWVDQGKAPRDGAPIERPPPQFGKVFFRSGDGFEQDRARLRLTDSNLKWLEEANPPADGWTYVQVLAGERSPESRIERVKGAVRLPPGGRGVLVDSGVSLRAIVTATPSGERLLELRLGDDSSLDIWVHGEWVREVSFRGFDDALRRAPALVREYLTTARGASIG
jgi:hypothetical protein